MGCCCFLILALPTYMLFSISMAFTGDVPTWAWLAYFGTYGVVCSILGLGVARKSKPLIIIGLILVAAIIGVWTYALGFDGFGD